MLIEQGQLECREMAVNGWSVISLFFFFSHLCLKCKPHTQFFVLSIKSFTLLAQPVVFCEGRGATQLNDAHVPAG